MEQRKRVTYSWPVFFVEALGRALSAKMCPDQPRAFTKVNNSQAFPPGINRFFFFFDIFLSERAGVHDSNACLVKKNRTNIRRSDCLGPISNHV